MTTTIRSQITPAGGGAPDAGYDYRYTSLSAWDSARRSNLVTNDLIEVVEVFSGGNAGAVTIQNGWVMGAANYVEIKAADGHQHNGVWDTNKAYVQNDTGVGIYINSAIGTDIKYVKITGLQVKSTNGLAIQVTTTAGITVDKSIVIGATYGFYTQYSSGTIQNSVVILTNTTGQICGLWTQGATSVFNVYNSTIISTSSSGTKYGVLIYQSSTINSQNNYIAVGNGSAYANGGGTFSKGANDATSNTEATTASLRNIAYSTANFTNVTYGSEDLKILESSSLKHAGADLTASGVTEDIIGTTRPQGSGYDIGAFELPVILQGLKITIGDGTATGNLTSISIGDGTATGQLSKINF